MEFIYFENVVILCKRFFLLVFISCEVKIIYKQLTLIFIREIKYKNECDLNYS